MKGRDIMNKSNKIHFLGNIFKFANSSCKTVWVPHKTSKCSKLSLGIAFLTSFAQNCSSFRDILNIAINIKRVESKKKEIKNQFRKRTDKYLFYFKLTTLFALTLLSCKRNHFRHFKTTERHKGLFWQICIFLYLIVSDNKATNFWNIFRWIKAWGVDIHKTQANLLV